MKLAPHGDVNTTASADNGSRVTPHLQTGSPAAHASQPGQAPASPMGHDAGTSDGYDEEGEDGSGGGKGTAKGSHSSRGAELAIAAHGLHPATLHTGIAHPGPMRRPFGGRGGY